MIAALSAPPAAAQSSPPLSGPLVAAAAPPQQFVAAALSRLVESSIPLEYDKQKDWGATTEIPVGLRVQGHGFDFKLKKRTRAVPHGVWKHYTLRLVDPRQNLRVQLADLRTLPSGRTAFTLHLAAKVDAWGRAKVYQYGVHLIALEMESDLRVRLAIQGELGVETTGSGAETALAIVPVVTRADVAIDEFHLRRVSNADGPIVRELSGGVRRLVEDELNGPQLVEKLNRSIEKRRDALSFRPAELFHGDWWPFAAAAAHGNEVSAPLPRGDGAEGAEGDGGAGPNVATSRTEFGR